MRFLWHMEFNPEIKANSFVFCQMMFFSRQGRSSFFSLICFLNFFLNLDHGIFPACTQELKRDLTLSDLQLGFLGSVVYVGLLLGSLLCGKCLQIYDSKRVIGFSLLGNLSSLLLFLASSNFWILCLSRTLVGCFQAFLVIYCPLWSNLHGAEQKTRWIMFLQLGVAAGTFTGYAITAFFVRFLSVEPILFCSFLIFASGDSLSISRYVCYLCLSSCFLPLNDK